MIHMALVDMRMSLKTRKTSLEPAPVPLHLLKRRHVRCDEVSQLRIPSLFSIPDTKLLNLREVN